MILPKLLAPPRLRLWLPLLLLIGVSQSAFSQCSNCNSQYPSATQSTTSNSLVTVSTLMWGGDYAVFQVTSGETYTWTTCGSTSFNTQLTLRQGTGCSGAVLGYNDDDCGTRSTITWTATFTGVVTVLVSQFNCVNNSTSTTLKWACTTCIQTPVCEDLIVNTTHFSQNGLTTAGAGDDFSSSDACGSSYMNGDDYVIEYTPDVSGCVDINLTNTDTWVGLFLTDACPNSSSANCVGSQTEIGGNPSLTGMNVIAGQTYYITVSTFPSPQHTPFDIEIVACAPPPANDECINAQPVVVNPDHLCEYITHGTVKRATASGQNNGCFGSANDDVWYSFVATQTTHTISLLNVTGSTGDLYHSVYEGTCNSLGAAVMCSDPNQSTISDLIIGNLYFVRVYTWANSNHTTAFDICIGIPFPGADCIGGTTVCSDETFAGNSSGSGMNELNSANRGCLSSNENQSSWYLFSAASTGLLEFTITPQTPTDYDFAIWGPYPPGSLANTVCVPNQPPLRCSYAAGGDPTGLMAGAGDYSEGAGGDRWVEAINMNAGEVFVLLIDNFATNNIAFEMSFNLPDGGILDCTPLPIELGAFVGRAIPTGNELLWQTLSEINNDYFALEAAVDGVHFHEIHRKPGAGNSTAVLNYRHLDTDPPAKITYYRLKQVDFDGMSSYSDVVALERKTPTHTHIHPNPTSGMVYMETSYPGEKNFTLYDTRGVPVFRHSSTETGEIRLDFGPSLAAGVYVLRVSTPDGHEVLTEKIAVYAR